MTEENRFKEIVSTQKIVDNLTGKEYDALVDDDFLQLINDVNKRADKNAELLDINFVAFHNNVCDLLDKHNIEDLDRLDEILEWRELISYNGVPKCKNQEKKEFDILKLDEESADFCDQWSHRKISSRLHNHGIDCFYVDMWGCDTIAFIVGIKSSIEDVARVLGIYKECIYYDVEHCFMILNLYQEKMLRESFLKK